MDFSPQPKTAPVRLKGKAYAEFRRQVYEDCLGKCAECGQYAPLGISGLFDLRLCGHVAHIKSHGSGGGDTIDNVRWLCAKCHLEGEHGPKWSRGNK